MAILKKFIEAKDMSEGEELEKYEDEGIDGFFDDVFGGIF
jgi:hypothetical protein